MSISKRRKRRVEMDRVYELSAIMKIALEKNLTIPVETVEEYNSLLIKWHSEIILEGKKHEKKEVKRNSRSETKRKFSI